MSLLIYLLKTAVLLTVGYGLYRVLLDRENWVQFKRFYLIGALLMAYLIPLLPVGYWPLEGEQTVEFASTSTKAKVYDYSATVASEQPLLQVAESVNLLSADTNAPTLSTRKWRFLALSVYLLGCSFFFFRLLRFWWLLRQQIRSSTQRTYQKSYSGRRVGTGYSTLFRTLYFLCG
ncbi:MAG: hypothetical protein AAF433_02915 [Bacteroidota bacterium]